MYTYLLHPPPMFHRWTEMLLFVQHRTCSARLAVQYRYRLLPRYFCGVGNGRLTGHVRHIDWSDGAGRRETTVRRAGRARPGC